MGALTLAKSVTTRILLPWMAVLAVVSTLSSCVKWPGVTPILQINVDIRCVCGSVDGVKLLASTSASG